LQPEAVAKIPRPSLPGNPFVVVVNGERIYLGLFTTSVGSAPFAVPTILVDHRSYETNQPSDTIVIDRAYPSPSFGVGPDPRGDPRIKAALKALHKLAGDESSCSPSSLEPSIAAPSGAIAGEKAKPSFGIFMPKLDVYTRTKDVTDRINTYLYHSKPGEIPLAAYPIITEDDLESYDWETHTMHLKHSLWSKVLQPQMGGLPFVVVVDGTPLFIGTFWSSLSSFGPPPVPIIAWDYQKKSDGIQISGAAEVADIERLKKVLEKLGKLKNNISDAQILQFHNTIKNQISLFETNKTVESVRQMEDLANLLSVARSDNRIELTTTWFDILQMIDANITNNNRTITWHIIPPRDGTNGIQYPAGIAPEALKDPVARSNYEAAIKINNELIQNNNFQVALHTLEERASRSAEKYLKSHYALSKEDKEELKVILEKHALSPDRKKRIVEMFGLDK